MADLSSARIAVSITIFLSVTNIIGDIWVKRAVIGDTINGRYLAGGLAVYGLSALGWPFVMRILKLSDVGALYAVLTTVFAVISGVLFFGERLSFREGLGISLAVTSIIILSGKT